MATEYPRSSIIRERRCAQSRCWDCAASAQTHSPTVAGFTPGSFSVSPSGAATYTIPSKSPPASLAWIPSRPRYNSQSGNGPLDGLVDSRGCPRSALPANLRSGRSTRASTTTPTTASASMGSRLIPCPRPSPIRAAPGPVPHRARVFTRVIACGAAGTGRRRSSLGQVGPDHGVRQRCSTSYTPGSRPCGADTTPAWLGTVRVWAFDQALRPQGQLPNRHLPRTARLLPIRMTTRATTASRSAERLGGVRQRPGQSTRPATAYVAGSIITTLKRLQYVRTYAGANPVREYRLATTTTARSDLSPHKRHRVRQQRSMPRTCHFRLPPEQLRVHSTLQLLAHRQ